MSVATVDAGDKKQQIHDELVAAMNGIALDTPPAGEMAEASPHSATYTLDALDLHKRCGVPMVFTQDGRVKHTFNLADAQQARQLAMARWLDAEAVSARWQATGENWCRIYERLDAADRLWHSVNEGRDMAVLQHAMCIDGKPIGPSAQTWPIGVTAEWGLQLMRKSAQSPWRLFSAHFARQQIGTNKQRADAINKREMSEREPQWRPVANFERTHDECTLAALSARHAVLLLANRRLLVVDRDSNMVTGCTEPECLRTDGSGVKALAVACDSHVIALSTGAQVHVIIAPHTISNIAGGDFHVEVIDLVKKENGDTAPTQQATKAQHHATALAVLETDHTLFIGTSEGIVCECLVDCGARAVRQGRATACYADAEQDLLELQTRQRRYTHSGVEPIETLVALPGIPRAEANEISDCVQLLADTAHNSWVRIRHVFDFEAPREYAGLPGERSTVVRRDAPSLVHLHACCNVMAAHYRDTNTLLLLDHKSNRQIYVLQTQELFRDQKTDTPMYASATRRYQSVAMGVDYAVALMTNGDVFLLSPRDPEDRPTPGSEQERAELAAADGDAAEAALANASAAPPQQQQMQQ